jgi:hypothetical protein
MSTKKQREIFRQRRLEFDRRVAESRKIKEEDESIGKMTKAQLIDYAENNGIEIDKTAKKAEILEVIKDGN